MIYCISDIHGRIDLFEKMLKKIDLKEGDMLYVLGDTIDRGGGLSVLLKVKELSEKGLATLLLGNHEVMFLNNRSVHLDNRTMGTYQGMLKYYKGVSDAASFNIDRESEKRTFLGLINSFSSLTEKIEATKNMSEIQQQINKSVQCTMKCSDAEEWESFKDLENMSFEKWQDFCDFVFKAPYYKYIKVKNKNFVLVHGGIHENDVAKLLVREDFYMNKVNEKILKKMKCPKNSTIIFGHTTTRNLNLHTSHTYSLPHKIWYDTKYRDKIGIDCGASYPNGRLACLRLDDMQEFYVDNEEKYITPLEKISQFLKHED